MAVETLDADVAAFLIREIRTGIARLSDPRFRAVSGRVHTREWQQELDGGSRPSWQVIIRDDGTTDVDLVVGESSIGISVLAGTKALPTDAGDLARIVKSIVKATPRAETGNPVARVNSFRGPFPVAEPSTFVRQYMTCDLAVVSTPL